MDSRTNFGTSHWKWVIRMLKALLLSCVGMESDEHIIQFVAAEISWEFFMILLIRFVLLLQIFLKHLFKFQIIRFILAHLLNLLK